MIEDIKNFIDVLNSPVGYIFGFIMLACIIVCVYVAWVDDRTPYEWE